ncbi:MAG: hypothetical protein KDK07_25565 [Bauldia sp.]|nr:hypothetical protein [Bauldia sp.]
MSEHERDGLMDCLFSRQDHRLVNIKFFRGSRDLITESEFRKELQGSIERRRNAEKLPDRPPQTEKPAIDLTTIVAE